MLNNRLLRTIVSRIRTVLAKELGTPKQRIAYITGISLVLFSVHNIDQPGLELISLPSIGTLLLIFSVWFAYLHGKWSLGPKKIWIPLAIIALSIVVAGAAEWSYHGLGTALMGLVLFSVYLACRYLGRDIFKVFTVAVIIECAVVIYQGIAHPGMRTGGIFGGAIDASCGNYAMALRLLAFGTLASMHIRPSRRWILPIIVTVALCFTGAEEALLVGLILTVAILVRRDWNWRLAIIPAVIVVLFTVAFVTGNAQSLYGRFNDRVSAITEQASPLMEDTEDNDLYAGLNYASGHRLGVYLDVLNRISPIGHGYYVTEFGGIDKNVPHNVLLVIVDQVGPVAAIAWLWVTVVMTVRTRWKYLFIGILAMSILDHALWTQAAPWWWAAVGVASSRDPISGTDRIFDYENT